MLIWTNFVKWVGFNPNRKYTLYMWVSVDLSRRERRAWSSSRGEDKALIKKNKERGRYVGGWLAVWKLKVTHFISLDPSNQIKPKPVQPNMRWWNDCNLKIQNKTIASCLIQIKTKHMDFKLRTCHAKAYIWAPTVFLFCIFFLALPLFTQRTGVVFIYFFSVFMMSG